MEELKQCETCGCIYISSKKEHSPEECQHNLEYDRVMNTCGTYETTCECHDCETYFNPTIKRPLIDPEIAEKDLERIWSTIDRSNVKEAMCEQIYRSLLYSLVPYPMWKSLEDRKTYQSAIQHLKESGRIQEQNPEICRIHCCFITHLDSTTHPVWKVYYRFPRSTVKYEMSIYTDSGKLVFNSRGSEYYDSLEQQKSS